MSRVRVVQATSADLPVIRGAYARGRVIQQEQGESVWPEFAEEQLLDEIRAGALLRVMDGNTVAGVFSAEYEDPAIWGELERGAHIYLHRISRVENHFGGSIVEAIVSWALARCDALGREGLRIDTWATNEPLIAYYGKFGFEMIGRRFIPADPRLSVHYHGTELALLERPRTSRQMHVEPATRADLDAIRGAYANAQATQRQQHAPEWPDFSTESILAEIDDRRLYRIMDGDAIAGVFTVAYDDPAIWGDMERGAHIYLHRIARTEHRASGRIMDTIVDWATTRCEELGREGLRIDTWAANPALVAYYGTFGFDLVTTRRMGDDPRLSPHYRGLELALLETPRTVAAAR